jgi:hypothetical protein
VQTANQQQADKSTTHLDITQSNRRKHSMGYKQSHNGEEDSSQTPYSSYTYSIRKQLRRQDKKMRLKCKRYYEISSQNYSLIFHIKFEILSKNKSTIINSNIDKYSFFFFWCKNITYCSSNQYTKIGCTFKLSTIITCKRPGVSFSINSLVASGVTSLGVKPVPPSLKILIINRKKKSLQNNVKILRYFHQKK